MVSLAPIAFAALFFSIMGIAIARYTYLYSRAKLDAPDAPAGKAADEGLKQEVTALRARVAVLEELATDEDRRLATDIERLRRPEAASSL